MELRVKIADDKICIRKRLRAIREYTSQRVCEHTPPSSTTYYNVTFAREDGIVVADCDFGSKEEAEIIIEAVNKHYDSLGEKGDHSHGWLEDDLDGLYT